MTTVTQERTQVRTTSTESPKQEALLDAVLEQTAANLDTVASRYAGAVWNPALGQLKRAMLMARAVDELRKAITPEIMRMVMKLQNTRLGFRTDRGPGANKPPYTEDVVRECLIDALLNGVFPIGNEYNIISGQLYITKEGYQRKVKETPGLTDLRLSPGVPQIHNGKTVVRFGASWKLNGRPDSLCDGEGKPGRVFEIPSNQYMGPDAIVGKSTRKALKAIYEQIHGSEHSVPDGEVGEEVATLTLGTGADLTPTTSPPDGKQSLRRNGNGTHTPVAPPVDPAEITSEQEAEIRQQEEESAGTTEATAGGEAEAGDGEKDVIAQELVDQIQAAGTEPELYQASREMGNRKEWLGEERYRKIQEAYSERYAVVVKNRKKR